MTTVYSVCKTHFLQADKKEKNYEKIGKNVLTNGKGSAIIKFAAKKWWR